MSDDLKIPSVCWTGELWRDVEQEPLLAKFMWMELTDLFKAPAGISGDVNGQRSLARAYLSWRPLPWPPPPVSH